MAKGGSPGGGAGVALMGLAAAGVYGAILVTPLVMSDRLHNDREAAEAAALAARAAEPDTPPGGLARDPDAAPPVTSARVDRPATGPLVSPPAGLPDEVAQTTPAPDDAPAPSVTPPPSTGPRLPQSGEVAGLPAGLDPTSDDLGDDEAVATSAPVSPDAAAPATPSGPPLEFIIQFEPAAGEELRDAFLRDPAEARSLFAERAQRDPRFAGMRLDQVSWGFQAKVSFREWTPRDPAERFAFAQEVVSRLSDAEGVSYAEPNLVGVRGVE